MAYELRFPSTANSLSGRKATGQKKPRVKAASHLAWIRGLPPLVGSRPVEAAHVRFADPRYRKPAVGMGEKPDDRWTVPLGADAHREQHSMDERAFWDKHGIDPCLVAMLLWNASGDDDEGADIIRQAQTTLRRETT
jgi:hypothetical protein